MPAKKKWGQNFLRNPGAVRRIVEALEPQPDDLILEIGPGEGVLTRELIRLPNNLIAIEIDPELAERLSSEFGDRLQLVHDDATVAELPAQPFRAIGNLPYNVATPIIRRILMSPRWQRAVFMVQKEVADRFTAHPGDEAYGYLTLLTQLYARTHKLLTLEPGSFFPRPKVRSAVVVFDPVAETTNAPRAEIEELLSPAFRMRRKKLLNNLDGFRGLNRTAVATIIEESGLGANARAEELSLAEFDRLASTIGRVAGAEVDRP